MDTSSIVVISFYFAIINSFVIEENENDKNKLEIGEELNDDGHSLENDVKHLESDNPSNVFNGVYAECFFHLSYTCLQKKTLLYLKELNELNEISMIGDYVKFVKVNNSENLNDVEESSIALGQSTDELAYMIDKAVDKFFDNHLIRFRALGKEVLVPNKEEEFVGRKKRKGGGGGGHGGGDGDGGKKKMMMMAMMCMKMKLMMMVPAMMGMMGMMSFKGMMFSMMSFMISKMMLLMKILEKKGGAGGGNGGSGWASDGGWASGGGGGGAWMPSGQDYGGGGGYDANGQWQSRSIIEGKDIPIRDDIPIFSYTKPILRYNPINKINVVKPLSQIRRINDEVAKNHHEIKTKSRKKRENGYGENGKWAIKSVIVNGKETHSEKTPVTLNTDPITKYEENNIFSEIKSIAQHIDANEEGTEIKNYIKPKSQENVGNYGAIIQRQSRSIIEDEREKVPAVLYANSIRKIVHDKTGETKPKSREKRGIIDVLQNAYMYWAKKVLGLEMKRPHIYPKYKVFNGVKYIYHPVRSVKVKPKELQPNANVVKDNDMKSVVVDDFNKGEIMEGPIESRMIRKKLHKMKQNVNETVDMIEDNPWE